LVCCSSPASRAEPVEAAAFAAGFLDDFLAGACCFFPAAFFFFLPDPAALPLALSELTARFYAIGATHNPSGAARVDAPPRGHERTRAARIDA